MAGLLVLLGISGLSGVRAQTWGLVWRLPDDTVQVLQQWQHIRQTGTEALRLETDSVPPWLLAAADSLGLALFVELPITEEPARQLRRRLPEAREMLRRLLEQAAGHPSVRAVGLARLADTVDPEACPYFESLRDEVRRARPDLHVYYETRFIEAIGAGRPWILCCWTRAMPPIPCSCSDAGSRRIRRCLSDSGGWYLGPGRYAPRPARAALARMAGALPGASPGPSAGGLRRMGIRLPLAGCRAPTAGAAPGSPVYGSLWPARSAGAGATGA
ncbi:hypothetical protein [Rhodothermus marinus]|uniref:hypothetical protein n=1 Tax=Rhodothermus marinus TaxID=29549 RepID=UPI001FB2A710|nr:hypothetical protein [Rhodothermus marinus]